MTPLMEHDTYVLGRSAAETRRLILQGDFQAPYTRRFLLDAGIEAGMRVLDIGSGAGDVALLAADLVGPQGSVVGIDVNPRVLDTARQRAGAAGSENVSFVAGDINDDGLAALVAHGPFDAVIGRLVLLYLPQPAATLRALSHLVRPGGIVAFQEFDLGAGSMEQFPPTPLWGQVWGWLRDGFLAAGVDEHIGLRLQQHFRDAGLPAPRLQLVSALGGGIAWGGYAYAEATLRSLLPALERFGIAKAEEVDIDTLAARLRAETVGSGGIVKTPDFIGAWTNVA
jgi:SAM-dependent methyltransferase